MGIHDAEYEVMRAWFAHMVPKIFVGVPFTPDTDPVLVLDGIAATSRAEARSGLGMAIGDMVDLSLCWPDEAVAQCDDELLGLGLPTLSSMRLRFDRLVRRALTRGTIKNEDEYYAVRNAVDHSGPDAEALWTMLANYEAAL
ncbi:MAG: hypothetical protein ACKOPR_09440 [Chakrabartia godavariana]